MNEKNSAQLVYQSNEIVLTNTEAKLSPLPKEYNFNADENDIKDSWITGPYYEFPTVKTETNGNKYYSTKGNSRVESVKAIPINPNFNYSLSGDFKVTGNETSTSLVYLALMPMTNDYSRIYKYEHLKFGTHATLSNYDENSKTITVTNASDLSGWLQDSSKPYYSRLIGFYFDGNTNKIPDYTFVYNINSIPGLPTGSYSNISNNVINLNAVLPQEIKNKIINGVTKISNNSSGSTYMYASSLNLSSLSFTNLNGSFTGTNLDLAPREDLFPYNTKWAKIVVLTDSTKDSSTTSTDFDNIKLTVTGDQPIYSWQKPSISATTPSQFSSKLTKMSHILTSGTDNQIGYQLSTDGGKTWKYFDTKTNTWEIDYFNRHDMIAVNSGSEYYYTTLRNSNDIPTYNDINTINAHIQELDNDGGSVTWRAYFLSDGTQQIGLSQVSFESTYPTLTSISPQSGLISGGNTITITGTDFDPSVKYQIKFGDVLTSEISNITSSSMQVVVPSSTKVGWVNMSVIYPGGETKAVGYTYYTVPGVPTIGKATGNADSTILLTWTAPNNNGAPITNYNVEFCVSSVDYACPSGTWRKVVKGEENAEKLSIIGYENGVGLVFRVSAVNIAGVSSFSEISNSTYSYNIPSAPISLTAVPAANSIKLNWLPPSSNNGSAITDYKVEHCVSDGSGVCSGEWTVFPDGVSTNTYATVTGLVGSSSNYYTFRVSAINAAGTGTASNVVSERASYVTLSSKGGVAISLTPLTSGSVTSSSSDTLAISTNNPAGYALTMQSTSANNNLNSGSNVIKSLDSSITKVNPTQLQDNTWGYRMDGVSNFGNLNTTQLINVTTTNQTFAAIPTTAEPIRYQYNPVLNDTFNVWFGTKVNSHIPAGTYTSTVLYTLVAR